MDSDPSLEILIDLKTQDSLKKAALLRYLDLAEKECELAFLQALLDYREQVGEPGKQEIAILRAIHMDSIEDIVARFESAWDRYTSNLDIW